MITQLTETASKFTSTIQNTLTKSTAIVSDKLNLAENYNNISNKFADNYKQLKEYYPSLTESLTTTRSTFDNGTKYIYSIPTSVGDKVYSYASIFDFQPVDGTEEEISRAHPNSSLAENVIPLKDERIEMVNHILNLYGNKITDECFKYYDEKVVYDDQISHSDSLADLKTQFYGSTNLLKSPIVNYKVLENTLTVLRISLYQKHYIPLFNSLIGYGLNLNTIIVLDLDDEGKKIIGHTVLFCGQKPIKRAEILRKGAAKVRSTLVKVPESK